MIILFEKTESSLSWVLSKNNKLFSKTGFLNISKVRFWFGVNQGSMDHPLDEWYFNTLKPSVTEVQSEGTRKFGSDKRIKVRWLGTKPGRGHQTRVGYSLSVYGNNQCLTKWCIWLLSHKYSASFAHYQIQIISSWRKMIKIDSGIPSHQYLWHVAMNLLKYWLLREKFCMVKIGLPRLESYLYHMAHMIWAISYLR